MNPLKNMNKENKMMAVRLSSNLELRVKEYSGSKRCEKHSTKYANYSLKLMQQQYHENRLSESTQFNIAISQFYNYILNSLFQSTYQLLVRFPLSLHLCKALSDCGFLTTGVAGDHLVDPRTFTCIGICKPIPSPATQLLDKQED